MDLSGVTGTDLAALLRRLLVVLTRAPHIGWRRPPLASRVGLSSPRSSCPSVPAEARSHDRMISAEARSHDAGLLGRPAGAVQVWADVLEAEWYYDWRP